MITRPGATVFLCLLLICSGFNLAAQANSFRAQKVEMLSFNVGVNALFGGLGSLINKKENETNLRAFGNGLYKGAIGGAVSHTGLSMSHLIESERNMAYAWPARVVNAIGASIAQNAAANERILETLHFNLYLARLEYRPYQKKFSARLFTSSLFGLAMVGRGSRFDLGNTLRSGVLFFESSERFRGVVGSGRATGQVSSVGMRSDIQGDLFYSVFAEEIAHIQQYDRKVAANAFVRPLDTRLKSESPFYNTAAKYVYLDLNGPLFLLGYAFESIGNCNFFEQEAVHYANRVVNTCD